MRSGFDVAFSQPVAGRALRHALLVGAVLIMINFGDVILHGGVTMPQVLRMAFTALVPCMVSTLSSVEASRTSDPAEREPCDS